MNLEIKKFEELTGKDLYEILRIRAEVFVEEQKCIYNDLDRKDFEATHLIIKEEGKILAYLRILKQGVSYKECSLGRVLVAKDARGKGLARKIIKSGVECITNKWGKNKITIGAQGYLKEFYSSLGFRSISELYLEDGIPHIDMIYDKDIINKKDL